MTSQFMSNGKPACNGNSRQRIFFLFDLDGTLTKPGQPIDLEMYNFLMNEVKPKAHIGLVCGSGLSKISKQMGLKDQVLTDFEYVFCENGLVTYENGKLIGEESIQNFIGDDKLQQFINYSLGYMSQLQLPFKRGTFIEFRQGIINLCPVGRSCSQKERDQFEIYDKAHKILQTFVTDLTQKFHDFGLCFTVGGQISINVYPRGWDKTFCLKYLKDYPVIYFFGNKCQPGGNDYEIYKDPRTIGHEVFGPLDTKGLVLEILNHQQKGNGYKNGF